MLGEPVRLSCEAETKREDPGVDGGAGDGSIA